MKQIFLALLFALAEAACGSSGGTSTSPSPNPSPSPSPSNPTQLAMFVDTATGFSTSDVRDVQEQIVRFDIANNTLIWAADGRSFTGYPVIDSVFIRADKHFQVRFGTKDGQRRAYFTETATATICDIEVINGQLVISPTSVAVPGS